MVEEGGLADVLPTKTNFSKSSVWTPSGQSSPITHWNVDYKGNYQPVSHHVLRNLFLPLTFETNFIQAGKKES